MNDIVDKMTGLSAEYVDHDPDVVAFCHEAAAEITRLRAKRAALERDLVQADACNRGLVRLNEATQASRDATVKMLDSALHRETQLIEALQSIAANTCCDICREAALVARAALKGASHD